MPNSGKKHVSKFGPLNPIDLQQGLGSGLFKVAVQMLEDNIKQLPMTIETKGGHKMEIAIVFKSYKSPDGTTLEMK